MKVLGCWIRKMLDPQPSNKHGALALLGSAIAPAHAASVTLSSQQFPGSSVMQANTGDRLDFTYTLDTTGLTENLTSLTFTGARDNNNLILTGRDQTPETRRFDRRASSSRTYFYPRFISPRWFRGNFSQKP